MWSFAVIISKGPIGRKFMLCHTRKGSIQSANHILLFHVDIQLRQTYIKGQRVPSFIKNDSLKID